MSIQGISHIGLTVSDLNASSEWYSTVLGWPKQMQGSSDSTTFAYGTLEDGTVLVLRQHAAGAGDAFDETRSGLDHLSFTFASRADLDQLAERLAAADTTWTPIQTTEYAHVLNFRDPDNTALEGTAAR